MLLEGIKTVEEKVIIEVDAEAAFNKIIKSYEIANRPQYAEYIKDGYWCWDEDMRGRGSDIVNKLRQATREEIITYNEIKKIREYIRKK